MSVCVSAGDCARTLVKALEQKMGVATQHGQERQRIGVPLQVPLDLFRQENGNTFCVLEVPGAKRDSIMVHLDEQQNLLQISGFIEKPQPLRQKGDFVHREGMYGYWVREVQVPRDTKESQIKAHYSNGLLCVEIPESKGNKGVDVKVEV